LRVTTLESSVDDVEQAVQASDVVEKAVIRGVGLQEMVLDRVKQSGTSGFSPAAA
jgi:hypothetical protein